jgi:retron-type reverse transcriptase
VSGPKSFEISKHAVFEAYRRVKANHGAAGVDGESIELFEADLKANLYKLWNRMSSGCYMPPPVRMVEIPKPGGRGVRILGVPTVADRVAQTVAAMYLEPGVEKVFHPDSYGYRPGRSALDAVGVCRERCWRTDWVIDLDIQGFFDNLDHDLVLKAVAHHTNQRWILLYVQRWLSAPLQAQDGSLLARDRGSPQGSAISPLLANLFMHYAFDAWMAREFPAVRFERYCDDVVVHCRSEAEAHQVREAIAARLARCGGCNCIPIRPASSTARTEPGAAPTSTPRSRSWGTGFAHGWLRRGPGSTFSVSARPSVTTPPNVCGRGFAPGGCTCAVDGPWRSSRATSTPSCAGGSTTTGGSAARSCMPASTASMITWCGGSCRNTSGTGDDECEHGKPSGGPRGPTRGSSRT